MCELAGTPYPAPTRAKAIEAFRRVGEHFGRPCRPEELARMASDDMDVIGGLDPRTRYLLDTAQSRTLTGPQSSTEFLLHRLFLASALPKRPDRTMLDRVTDPDQDDVETLARAFLLQRPAWLDSPLVEAISRILARERRHKPNPRPEEISRLDVLAEVHNRGLFVEAGRPYPPRSTADVIAAVKVLADSHDRPSTAARLEEALRGRDEAVVAPRLVGYGAVELSALLMRTPTPTRRSDPITT
jgi:hypothetical protein